MKHRTRVSESIYIGPFRFRLSVPLFGRGRWWWSAGARTGRRAYTSVSGPLGGQQQRRRRS